MSKIDYQALREKAESTIGILENIAGFEPSDIDGDTVELRFETDGGFDTGCDVSIVDQCQKTADVVRALLDERERNQQYIKSRDQENEDIALTVGRLRVELEGKDSKIANLTAERDALREGEMGDARHSNTRAAADIYFQLVEECEIPAGGSLVEYVDDMREKLEAAERQILRLEKLAEAESAGADKSAASCVEWMKRCHAAEKRIAELESLTAPELPQPSPVVPAALPENDDDDGSDIDYLEPSEVYALGRKAGWNACRASMLQAEPVSNSDELPLDYLQGHKDGLEWAAQLAEANHPQTGDWLYDDQIDLARAIRKGPDMPTVQGGSSPVIPDGWVMVPKELTPEMMRAVQIRSELGGYATSNLSGAYNMFSEFWNVAVSAAPKVDDL